MTELVAETDKTIPALSATNISTTDQAGAGVHAKRRAQRCCRDPVPPRCERDPPRPWSNRSRGRKRSIVLVTALLVLGFPAPSLAARLDLIVNGRGTIVATIPNAGGTESARVVCTNPHPSEEQCEANYVPDRVVTLRAEPVPAGAGLSSFERWSDDRCPSGPVCEIAIDSDRQTVSASFSPQMVTVVMSSAPQGTGTVTSIPAGIACEALPDVARSCNGEFPLFTQVKLIAKGGGAQWEGLCDEIVGSTCSVSAHSRRPAVLVFPGGYYPCTWWCGGFGLQFRVAKDGTGSGTVRSASVDCGDKCSAFIDFGMRETLTAVPDRGSRFLRWRGACAESPRCSLAVGPVTRVTAVFQRLSAAGKAGGSKSPSKRRSSTQRPTAHRSFVAVVGRRVVVHGMRPRRMLFSVGVSAPSSIRAVLASLRGDRVTARTWQMRRGMRMLRLAVPRRARRGTYVLRVTARDRHGHVKQFARRVRLRR